MVLRILGKLCIAGIALTVAQANAAEPEGFDFATTLLVRTYSPGLSLNPTIGYGHRIWGETSTPWYGFVRPHLDGVVSPTLYEGRAGLEVFPISIFGVNVARTLSRRFADTKGQDCAAIQCQGELDYTDFTLQGYLGAGGFFSSLRFTRTFFDEVSDSTRPVYDLGTSILLKPNGEEGDYTTIALGKDLNDVFSIGVLIQNADFHRSGQHQEGQYLIAKSDLKWLGFENLSSTVGLGRFKSDLNVGELSAILSVTSTFTPAIGFGR
jgi:hypothetical protein